MSEQEIYEIISRQVDEAMAAAVITRFNEGGPAPDLASRDQPFALVNIVIDDVTTMALGPTAPKRYQGAVEVAVFVRTGSGNRKIRETKTELHKRLINVYLDGKVLMAHKAIGMGTRSISQWTGEGFQYMFSVDET